jgi:hypothetical protein
MVFDLYCTYPHRGCLISYYISARDAKLSWVSITLDISARSAACYEYGHTPQSYCYMILAIKLRTYVVRRMAVPLSWSALLSANKNLW